ncbi:hypothetical protein GCM10018777_08270 [Streptomyces albogriseolus]|nr:hypothetical protein GCM10018777_08270 [Streptomyces viridodiastaticus]
MDDVELIFPVTYFKQLHHAVDLRFADTWVRVQRRCTDAVEATCHFGVTGGEDRDVMPVENLARGEFGDQVFDGSIASGWDALPQGGHVCYAHAGLLPNTHDPPSERTGLNDRQAGLAYRYTKP